MNTHELFVENKFKQVAKLIPPNSKILDIGSGEGKIRNFLQSPDYYAIDGNKDYINSLVKEKIKAKTVDLNKDPLPFDTEKFDFVLMLDVLEHVADPRSLLIQAKNKLNDAGKIIVTLPNDYHLLNKLRFLLNKHLTEDPFAAYGHLHYFPIKSAEIFLIKNGFKVEKKVILPPVKPASVPQGLKNFLAGSFPQSFARDVLYLLSSAN
jgi:2-polyprenyl-3-methyl-5-hydroxy-6-metoxy-1,4-benzoquinol methylase